MLTPANSRVRNLAGEVNIVITRCFVYCQDLGAIANGMFKLKGPSCIKGSFAPAFPLKHQQKDMRLALALGDEVAQTMPVAAAANEV